MTCPVLAAFALTFTLAHRTPTKPRKTSPTLANCARTCYITDLQRK